MVALKDKGYFRARPHRGVVTHELISADGRSVATNSSAVYLAELAGRLWPDQEQDEERSGKGWDIAVVGAGR